LDWSGFLFSGTKSVKLFVDLLEHFGVGTVCDRLENVEKLTDGLVFWSDHHWGGWLTFTSKHIDDVLSCCLFFTPEFIKTLCRLPLQPNIPDHALGNALSISRSLEDVSGLVVLATCESQIVSECKHVWITFIFPAVLTLHHFLVIVFVVILLLFKVVIFIFFILILLILVFHVYIFFLVI
jgi:hypothetical protein